MLPQPLEEITVSPRIPDKQDELAASHAFRLDLKHVTEHNDIERLAFRSGLLVPILHGAEKVGTMSSGRRGEIGESDIDSITNCGPIEIIMIYNIYNNIYIILYFKYLIITYLETISRQDRDDRKEW
jgi:hypothetical protein